MFGLGHLTDSLPTRTERAIDCHRPSSIDGQRMSPGLSQLNSTPVLSDSVSPVPGSPEHEVFGAAPSDKHVWQFPTGKAEFHHVDLVRERPNRGDTKRISFSACAPWALDFQTPIETLENAPCTDAWMPSSTRGTRRES